MFQVQLGVSDRNILVIEHFRNLCDSLEMTNHLSTGASHANSASTSSAKMVCSMYLLLLCVFILLTLSLHFLIYRASSSRVILGNLPSNAGKP